MSKISKIKKWYDSSNFCPKCSKTIKSRCICVDCGRVAFTDIDFISKLFGVSLSTARLAIEVVNFKPNLTSNETQILCSGIIFGKISQDDISTVREANGFHQDKTIEWALNASTILNDGSIAIEDIIDSQAVTLIDQGRSPQHSSDVQTECIIRFIESSMRVRATALAALKERTRDEDEELIELTRSFMY